MAAGYHNLYLNQIYPHVISFYRRYCKWYRIMCRVIDWIKMRDFKNRKQAHIYIFTCNTMQQGPWKTTWLLILILQINERTMKGIDSHCSSSSVYVTGDHGVRTITLLCSDYLFRWCTDTVVFCSGVGSSGSNTKPVWCWRGSP